LPALLCWQFDRDNNPPTDRSTSRPAKLASLNLAPFLPTNLSLTGFAPSLQSRRKY
jgi:hypothetical protein